MSSCTTITRSTRTPRFFANEATGGPLTFMNCPAVIRSRGVPSALASANSTGEKRAFLLRTERRSHSRSTTIHPALCRVVAYRSPGLPSPTTSQGSATP